MMEVPHLRKLARECHWIAGQSERSGFELDPDFEVSLRLD